jgi:thiol-disulfide isomerase/thioredoxin
MTETQPAPGRTWWIVGLALVAAWCVYLYFFGPGRRHRAPELEGTELSKPADYGWSLYDLDGRAVPFERYRNKTVFLNVWATWCPPCVGELPSIARLARNPRLTNVAFVCASVDDDAVSVRRFLRGKDWPMIFLHAPALPNAFMTEGIPATFLIAPDGRIAASALGGAEWDDPTVVDFLARLAAPKPGTAPPAAQSGSRSSSD